MSQLLKDQRIAARIVSNILLELAQLSTPGTPLEMLDEIAERRIREEGAEPYNKNYKPDWAIEPYPATICCSVNHEICHAPPRGRSLRGGDIVKYDLGIRYKSGCGDAALTAAVGEIDNRKKRAMYYGLRALHEGIRVVKAGVPISEIGKAIEKFSRTNGYTVIREFGGHTIGAEMHEEPHIPHYYDPKYDKIFLEAGMVICIEPMLTPGTGKNAINAADRWTAFCTDYQPVVMFEAMILVRPEGHEVLTTHL